MKKKRCQSCKKLVKMDLGVPMKKVNGKWEVAAFTEICPVCDTEQVSKREKEGVK